jgi:hypothetical protein
MMAGMDAACAENVRSRTVTASAALNQTDQRLAAFRIRLRSCPELAQFPRENLATGTTLYTRSRIFRQLFRGRQLRLKVSGTLQSRQLVCWGTGLSSPACVVLKCLGRLKVARSQVQGGVQR